MIPHHVYGQLAILGLLGLCVILHDLWPSRGGLSPQPPADPGPPPFKRQRSNEPTPFEGLSKKPHRAACEHAASHPRGGPWRQCSGRSWRGYFLATPGTILHG